MTRLATASLPWLLTWALVASATAAHGETGSKPYHRGDHPAYLDLTRLQVVNGDDRATMRAHVRHLTSRGVFVFGYWRGGHQYSPARTLQVRIRLVDGEAVARFYICGREDCARHPCAGVHGAWHRRSDLVEASVPQRCYPRRAGTRPPRVGRFFVSAYQGRRADFGADRALRLRRG